LKDRVIDSAHLKTLLSHYAAVNLRAPTDHLKQSDRLALNKLVEAASWIDRIYWKQRLDDEMSYESVFAHGGNSADLERLFRLNYGPWDNFDDDRPFWGDRRRPPGGNLYPADLTRSEFERYLTNHPQQRRTLLSHTTLIRGRGEDLIAIPYAEAYRDELLQAARALNEAAGLATDKDFAGFLRARAKGLVTGSLQESEELWIRAGRSPIDIAIGPYEVYDDDLMGLKASYEATVLVRRADLLQRAELENVVPEIEAKMPGAMAPATSRRRVVVGVYDVFYAAGMTNRGGKAIAASLPNDERIRTEVGSRLLLFRNVISAKFGPILKALAERVLSQDQVRFVREDAFLEHTLLHEAAHALGTSFVWRDGRPTGATVNEVLRERYSSIDECRADLVGMVLLRALAKRGAVAEDDMDIASAVTFVVGGVRTLRFGAGDSYSQGGAIAISHLLKTGAVHARSDKLLVVNVDRVHAAIAELAPIVQGIATHGDYDAAGRLIGELGSMPREIEALRGTFSEIPIDIEFKFN
jgi:hypothetical protein